MTDDILTPQAANTLPFQPSTGGGGGKDTRQ